MFICSHECYGIEICEPICARVHAFVCTGPVQCPFLAEGTSLTEVEHIEDSHTHALSSNLRLCRCYSTLLKAQDVCVLLLGNFSVGPSASHLCSQP